MKDYEINFIIQDKERLIRLFAFKQGWCRTWLISQQQAMESLYGRKVDTLDAAIHCTNNQSYPVDYHSCLDHEFLQAFFTGFPQIEILERPDLTFVSPVVPPRMVESYKYEDAWKHHIQVLVLMNPEKRIGYLYSYVPIGLKEALEAKKEERRKRMNELSREATQ